MRIALFTFFTIALPACRDPGGDDCAEREPDTYMTNVVTPHQFTFADPAFTSVFTPPSGSDIVWLVSVGEEASMLKAFKDTTRFFDNLVAAIDLSGAPPAVGETREITLHAATCGPFGSSRGYLARIGLPESTYQCRDEHGVLTPASEAITTGTVEAISVTEFRIRANDATTQVDLSVALRAEVPNPHAGECLVKAQSIPPIE